MSERCPTAKPTYCGNIWKTYKTKSCIANYPNGTPGKCGVSHETWNLDNDRGPGRDKKTSSACGNGLFYKGDNCPDVQVTSIKTLPPPPSEGQRSFVFNGFHFILDFGRGVVWIFVNGKWAIGLVWTGTSWVTNNAIGPLLKNGFKGIQGVLWGMQGAFNGGLKAIRGLWNAMSYIMNLTSRDYVKYKQNVPEDLGAATVAPALPSNVPKETDLKELEKIGDAFDEQRKRKLANQYFKR